MYFNLPLLLLLIIVVNCDLPKPDNKYDNLTDDELFEHNQNQNIFCDVENRDFYQYTHHNFHTPVSRLEKVKPGFYPSIVYVNQEEEAINGSIVWSHNVTSCPGVILNEYFVLSFKSCVRQIKLQTVIRYGALSNNCTGCPITTAKEIYLKNEIDVALIYLKFPIRFSRSPIGLNRNSSQFNLNQPVGPSCELEKANTREFYRLSWFNLVSRGSDENKMDHLYHMPTQANRLGNNVITVSYGLNEATSESFLFKNDKEQLYLVGVCKMKKYSKLYCLKMKKYKQFIRDTMNAIRTSASGLKMVDNWNKPMKRSIITSKC